MFEERTGIPVERLVTAIAYDEPNGGCQLFVENRDDWIDGFIELREMYDTQLQSMLQSEGIQCRRIRSTRCFMITITMLLVMKNTCSRVRRHHRRTV